MAARKLHPLAPVLAFGGLAAALIAVHYLLPRGSGAQGLLYEAVGIASVVAVVAGLVLHRPARVAHLVLLALGLTATAVGDALFNYQQFVAGGASASSTADLAYVLAYVGYIGSVALVARRRHTAALSDALDAAIVTIGAGLLFWTILIQPIAADESAPVLDRIGSSLVPAFDVLLLVALAQLLTSSSVGTASFRFFTAGVAALLVPDVLYVLQTLHGGYEAGGLTDAGWMLGTTFWGMAALHPSVRLLHQLAPDRETRLTWRRLALLGGASLIPPVVALQHIDADATGILLVTLAASVTTVFVFARMALLFREHGRAVAELRDARAEAAAEQALRDSYERFESAATALECAIYEWNRDSDTMRWTTGLGHGPAAQRPQSWWEEHVHPDDLERIRWIDGASVGRASGPREHESEYRFRRGDGTYAHVLDRWVVSYDESGEAVRIVGGMVDVSHQRLLEARLQQSEKMEALGRLAGGVAHDFNNLLTAILGNAELLKLASPADPSWLEDVAEISRAADRAAELTGQLLTFSRGRVSHDVSAELDGAVDEMATMLGRLLGSDIEVDLVLRGGSRHVACEAGQLEQVILNLALNARDAMPQGGTLRIETSVAGPLARIVVSDTGTGMDEETSARVFEPFFTTKEPGKGTGLGLATVYGVVEHAGGSIFVRTAPGEGTAFELLLPWRDAPETASASSGTAAGEGTGSILLVEDEESVRAVVARMLESSGYAVVQSGSPLEALALLEEEPLPDLVVSDVVMPQLSGFALAARVAEQAPDLPFLFITGYTGTDDRPLGLERHPIVRKPFFADELVSAVRSLLEAPASRAA
ncbi:MAG: response regulator [Thermoleophilia bacterium]|nr:response regulator [Thermoleophilia bacterium]